MGEKNPHPPTGRQSALTERRAPSRLARTHTAKKEKEKRRRRVWSQHLLSLLLLKRDPPSYTSRTRTCGLPCFYAREWKSKSALTESGQQITRDVRTPLCKCHSPYRIVGKMYLKTLQVTPPVPDHSIKLYYNYFKTFFPEVYESASHCACAI